MHVLQMTGPRVRWPEPYTPENEDATPRMEELAKRVRAARSYAGLHQEDMASRLGVSVVTYKRIEQGRRQCTMDEVQRIAEITQMPAPFFSIDFKQLADITVQQGQLEEAGERIQGLVSRLEDLEFRMRQNME